MHKYSKLCRSFLVALAAMSCISLFASVALAQSGGGVDLMGTGGRHIIQGRIYYPSGRRSDSRLKIKLQSFNSGELSVFSDPNGSFSFKGLDPGSYTVVVEAGEAYEVAKEIVYIDTDGTSSRRGIPILPITRTYSVDIALRLKPAEVAKLGVVSAALAAVPDPARDLYLKALDSINAGDNLKAVEQLKGAIAIYPQFPLALNELGVRYLKLGQLAKAAEALKAAVGLAPEEFHPRLNYGIALLNQKFYPEAEEQLRVAVAKRSDAPTAHMYLGIALAMQRKFEEGQKELQLAMASNSTEVALAHRYLAGIYFETKQDSHGADELEIYLRLVPKTPEAEALRKKIKEIRAKK